MTSPVSRHLAATAAACACACVALFTLPAHAGELNSLQVLNQAQFRLLTEDVGSAAAYKGLIPSEATGVIGFDVGAALISSQVRNRDVYTAASNGDDPGSVLNQVALRANKGLPFDVDIGASLGAVGSSNIRVAGADVRWAAILGGTFIPAVSLRLAVSNITGVDQLDLNTISYDVSLSKGFALITPYAGVGQVRVKATPNNAGLLQEEKFNLTRVFAGTNVALGLMNFILEVDRTGDNANIGMKLGVRF